VPANNGDRLHDDQDIGPARPDAPQSHPEEPGGWESEDDCGQKLHSAT
jgi:hypothetical protein